LASSTGTKVPDRLVLFLKRVITCLEALRQNGE
jgi:hypothetical protein